MTSNSYLLKTTAPPPPYGRQPPYAPQPCQCRHAKARTSCGVLLALLLLLALTLGLAANAYCMWMRLLPLLPLQDRVRVMGDEVRVVSGMLNRLHVIDQMRTFEGRRPQARGAEDDSAYDYFYDGDVGEEEDDDEEHDPAEPIYVDTEDTNLVEAKARDQDVSVHVPRLEPAGGGHNLQAATTTPTTTTTATPTTTTTATAAEPVYIDRRRRRRQVQQAGQPQLKLYHTLQSAQPAEMTWSQHGARYGGRTQQFQPMYAEHAPLAYAAPPRPTVDAAPTPSEARPHRHQHRHQHRDQQRDQQRLRQFQQHEDVTQQMVQLPQRYVGASTTIAPVASRRSRVMDVAATPPAPNARQHYQQQRQQYYQQEQQQRLRQFPDLQDVTQEVPQGRSVEVGRPRWQQQQQQQQWRGVQTARPSSRPPSWPAPERAGREPWQDRVRTTRSIDASVDVAQTWRPYTPAVVEGPAIAAHFVGDTARHRGSHHYDDNGRLKHPTGEYADWTASPWVSELGLDHHFKLASTGTHIVVDTPGLYLVYAQVNYANDKDENGFWVYRNQQKELLCATATTGRDVRANTCFTAAVLHLRQGDRVSLKDLAGERYRVLDHPGRSFVGMVNLSACKLKAEQPGRATD